MDTVTEIGLPARIAEISSEGTLRVIRCTIDDEIASRRRRADLVKLRADLAFSPLTTAECAGEMIRLVAEINTLVRLRDQMLPSLEKKLPALIAEVVAEKLGYDYDDEGY